MLASVGNGERIREMSNYRYNTNDKIVRHDLCRECSKEFRYYIKEASIIGWSVVQPKSEREQRIYDDQFFCSKRCAENYHWKSDPKNLQAKTFSFAGGSEGDECFRFGISSGCHPDCPVFERGECKRQEENEIYFTEQGY